MLLSEPRSIPESLLDICDTFTVTQNSLPVFLSFIAGFLRSRSVRAVDSVCRQILRDASSADYRELALDLSDLFDFLLSTPYVDSLIELTKLLFAQNPVFHAELADEMDLLLNRPAECPYIALLDIAVNAESTEAALERYERVCANVKNERTSALLFEYFEIRGFTGVTFLKAAFAVAPAASKVEKRVFGTVVRGMEDVEFADFVKAWGSRIIPTRLRVMDARKLHLLMKWRPGARSGIVAAVGLIQERVIAAAFADSEAAVVKYLRKAFPEL
jgi:hypothetical protein